mgnify:FL=1
MDSLIRTIIKEEIDRRELPADLGHGRLDEALLLENRLIDWAKNTLKASLPRLGKLKFKYLEKGNEVWIVATGSGRYEAMMFSGGSRKSNLREFASESDVNEFVTSIKASGFKQVTSSKNIKKSIRGRVSTFAAVLATAATITSVTLVVAALMGAVFPFSAQIAASATGIGSRLLGLITGSGDWSTFTNTTEYKDIILGDPAVERIHIPGARSETYIF